MEKGGNFPLLKPICSLKDMDSNVLSGSNELTVMTKHLRKNEGTN